MAVDIFSAGKPAQFTWASFKQINDAVQGTYINKFRGMSPQNKPQVIYELLQEDGSVIRYGVAEERKTFHQLMDLISFGQIVGFKFTSTKPSRTAGMQDAKIITIWSDPLVVNKEWIEKQKELASFREANRFESSEPKQVSMTEEDEEIDTGGWGAWGNDLPKDEDPTVEPATEPLSADQEKLQMIGELAKQKLGVEGDASTIKDKVMEATGLAFLPINFDKIIEALKAL